MKQNRVEIGEPSSGLGSSAVFSPVAGEGGLGLLSRGQVSFRI